MVFALPRFQLEVTGRRKLYEIAVQEEERTQMLVNTEPIQQRKPLHIALFWKYFTMNFGYCLVASAQVPGSMIFLQTFILLFTHQCVALVPFS
mgnify:CR=1 FL=1